MDLFDDEIPDPVTQELPIPDYNHLPRLDVESRSRQLDAEGLELVLRYERTHRDRTPVAQFLTARLRRLRDQGREDRRVKGGYGPAPRSSRPL
ncbi:hypothetical protein [Streptomyces sp. NBC_01198]|uniref:hypothetical protein n=1 Tax=Streptomyces sp. NBC_01198 TaxID=2903769 RepID=UPI002E0F6FC3|nr:hypothetical protein OG702_02500 [Streptomyces sp. NBC_01198]